MRGQTEEAKFDKGTNDTAVKGSEQTHKSFQETHALQVRKIMVLASKLKKPDCFFVVIEKDPKCTVLPHLKNPKFSIPKDYTMMFVVENLKNLLQDLRHEDAEIPKESLFVFTRKGRVIIDKNLKFGDLSPKHVDEDDGIVYLMYSNMNPFGGGTRRTVLI